MHMRTDLFTVLVFFFSFVNPGCGILLATWRVFLEKEVYPTSAPGPMIQVFSWVRVAHFCLMVQCMCLVILRHLLVLSIF